MVVLGEELIEPFLLFLYGFFGRSYRLCLERSMNALVSTILGRTPSLDSLGPYPELNPLDGQRTQIVDAREGHAVVRSNHIGQSEFAKGCLKHGVRHHRIGAWQRLAAQEVPRKTVGNRYRVTSTPAAKSEMAFEVSALDRVGT